MKINKLFLAISLSVSAISTPAFAVQTEEGTDKKAVYRTIDMGGAANIRFRDEATAVVSMNSGPFQSVVATVDSQYPLSDGTYESEFTHFFVAPNGGYIWTKDIAISTPVPNTDKMAIQVKYEVIDSGGSMAGARGSFTSQGLLDPNNGVAVLRFDGQIYLPEELYVIK